MGSQLPAAFRQLFQLVSIRARVREIGIIPQLPAHSFRSQAGELVVYVIAKPQRAG